MQKMHLFLLLPVVFSLAARAQSVPYASCPGCWNPDTLGNHRAVIRCNSAGGTAHVRIPWRLRISDPASHRIIVQDATTGARIANAAADSLSRESGDVFFQPLSGKGLYYIYYLPYKNEGTSNYPKGIYWRPDTTATPEWLTALKHSTPLNCTVTAFQSIDSFNTFYPMEVIATAKETAALKAKHAGRSFFVFPEDRDHPIRLRTDLPYRWIGKPPGTAVSGEAARGEWFAYQLGLYAMKDLAAVQVRFGPLTDAAGNTIPAANSSCINTGGIGYDGRPFTKNISVKTGQVQPLWCGIDIPRDIIPGGYEGTVTVFAGGATWTGRIIIGITPKQLTDGGAGTPQKMTRLRWLNSTLAQENTVIAPYTPLIIRGDTLIGLLGRDIRLNNQGFPEQIRTYFTPEMTEIGAVPNPLLAENIHFHFTRRSDGKDIRLKSQGLRFTKKTPGTVCWQATNRSDELQMDVSASLEFDGFLAYTVKITALQDIDLKDITMHIPFQKEVATYLMGLGQKGGHRPDSMFHWKWDVAHKNQDGAWIGTVNAGLQYSLRDEHYVRPLNTNFYLQKPLVAPGSWANEGNGGIDIGIKGKSMLANNYGGPRQLKKGDTLYYNFNLLITPFHPLNTDAQWATRFYHKYDDPRSIAATGATVINIHHATPINPWINYPFIEWRRMKGYIDTAHSLGLKVKIYNTVRELSDHAYELFAMRSLGNEIYTPGQGKGFSWLQEHVGDDYIPAWFVPEIKDAALINSGVSRWHNYYVEGMNWLVQNAGIDGIYLDDVAFDRVTMKRIKRVLTQDGHPGMIDLHSANQYNPRDGFNNSANLYM
ncbi:MAG TPA: glycoside hydrolase domain-containing protein, partial [Puia sp.]|nr:glycoside hydrolase domain-containing protein [Puia sp.]